MAFRAAAADCAYGDIDTFRAELRAAGVPFVLALKRRRGVWAYGEAAHTPEDAAYALAWDGPHRPGAWRAVVRTFRDGHTETWWAAEACLGWWGPDGDTRLVVATTDPARLPEHSTWYLATDLPRPGSPRAAASPYAPAVLAELVWIYGIRNWIEQGYKQVKNELGGPTSRSAAPERSTGIWSWCAARSASAGRPPTPRSRAPLRPAAGGRV